MQKERALSSDAFSSTVLDAIPSMMRLVDENGAVLYANSALSARFGDDTELKTPCMAIRCSECVAKRCIRDERRYTAISRSRGRVYSVDAGPVRLGGSVYALEVFTDITKEQKLKDKLMENNSRMMKDLEIARSLQLSILRHNLPDIGGYGFCAEFLPCEALGGDMYDCFLTRDGRILMYIADVSGHGVMPAMLTVYLRQEMFAQCKTPGISPSRVLRNIQDSFEELRTEESIYITIFMITIDPDTGEYVCANAGHSVPPLIAGETGVRELFVPGTPVCRWVDGGTREEQRGVLSPGEKLFLYTDGLDGVHSGTASSRGLHEILQSPQFHERMLLEEIKKNFTRTRADDVTMLLCERY
jgi:sigma-B regulation protein RsbU (phosphoserine phosphatase)